VLLAAAAVALSCYLRYRVIEQPTIGIACETGGTSSLCAIRRATITLFQLSALGTVALAAAVLNLLRPSVVLVAIALVAAGFGIVLYNVALSALAVALLVLSLARPAPEPE
jgi:hypothetical protein